MFLTQYHSYGNSTFLREEDKQMEYYIKLQERQGNTESETRLLPFTFYKLRVNDTMSSDFIRYNLIGERKVGNDIETLIYKYNKWQVSNVHLDMMPREAIPINKKRRAKICVLHPCSHSHVSKKEYCYC
jgi:hypothetical protein